MSTTRNKSALLSKASLFQSAAPDAVKKLAGACEIRKVERQAPLWAVGQQGVGPVLVRTGAVREMVTHGARSLTLGLHGKGELVGAELALGLAAAGTVDAYEDCVLLQLPADALIELARTDAGVANALARVEAQRRIDLQGRLCAIAQNPASQRLAEVLIALGKRFGVRDSRGLTINLRLTHAELAALIGATRETVSFLVSDLRRDKLIERDGKRVILVDRRALGRLAAGEGTSA